MDPKGEDSLVSRTWLGVVGRIWGKSSHAGGRDRTVAEWTNNCRDEPACKMMAQLQR